MIKPILIVKAPNLVYEVVRQTLAKSPIEKDYYVLVVNDNRTDFEFQIICVEDVQSIKFKDFEELINQLNEYSKVG